MLILPIDELGPFATALAGDRRSCDVGSHELGLFEVVTKQLRQAVFLVNIDAPCVDDLSILRINLSCFVEWWWWSSRRL